MMEEEVERLEADFINRKSRLRRQKEARAYREAEMGEKTEKEIEKWD